MSVISASVVRIIAAMEAAFSSAERVTFAASITPASTMSSVLLSRTLKPMFLSFFSFCAANRLDNHRAILTSVGGNRAQRLFQGAAQNLHAGRCIALSLHLIQRLNGVQQRDAA